MPACATWRFSSSIYSSSSADSQDLAASVLSWRSPFSSQITLAFGIEINKDVHAEFQIRLKFRGLGVGRIAHARSGYPTSPFDHNNCEVCSARRSSHWIGSSLESVRFGLGRVGFAGWRSPSSHPLLLSFHRALVKRKYRVLFSPKQKTKPGSKGPTADLIRAVVEMKQRNPIWGCPHIADQINLAFGTSINKDVVRRILAQHYRPMPTEGGPSWLTFIGHVKDSLWSLDLFRCESVDLNVLGTGRDGPIHAQNHRVWNSGWRRRWHGAPPDVQSSDSMANGSEISEFRS